MKRLVEEIRRIPEFIVSTDVMHYSVWNKMLDCNDILYTIATCGILNNSSLNGLIKRFDIIMDDIAFVINPDDFLMISKYYDKLEEFFINEMLDKENYEGLENFKNFNTKYLQFIRG